MVNLVLTIGTKPFRLLSRSLHHNSIQRYGHVNKYLLNYDPRAFESMRRLSLRSHSSFPPGHDNDINSMRDQPITSNSTILEEGLRELRNAALALEDRFQYSEKRTLKSCAVKYLDKENNEHQIQFPLSTHRVLPKRTDETDDTEIPYELAMNEDFRTLLGAADKSPFGHYKETVYDDNVRKAKHIEASRILEVKLDNDDVLEGIKQRIHTCLFPLETGIEMKVSVNNVLSSNLLTLAWLWGSVVIEA